MRSRSLGGVDGGRKKSAQPLEEAVLTGKRRNTLCRRRDGARRATPGSERTLLHKEVLDDYCKGKTTAITREKKMQMWANIRKTQVELIVPPGLTTAISELSFPGQKGGVEVKGS